MQIRAKKNRLLAIVTAIAVAVSMMCIVQTANSITASAAVDPEPASDKIMLKTPKVSLKVSDRTATVTWNSIKHAETYVVMRSRDNGDFKTADVVTSTSFEQKNLLRQHTYKYKVQAVPGSEDEKYDISNLSEEVKACIALKKTEIKSIADKGHCKVKLEWNSIKGSKKYTVYRAKEQNGTYKKVKSSDKNSCIASVPTFKKKYFFKVKAIGTAKVYNSDSNSKSIKLTIPKSSISRIEPYSVNSLRIRYKKNEKCDGYAIYRAATKKSKYYKIAEYSSSHKNNFVNSGLTCGKTYCYKIKSYRTANGKKYYSKFSGSKGLKVFKLCWPAPGYKVKSSAYGWRINPVTHEKQFHEGIDVPCPKNAPVKAALSGIVTFAAEDGIYGNKVVIRSSHGFVTKYCHNTSLAVSEGQRVEKGQTIAYAGTTGRSTGNHLHFEVWVYGKHHNPNSFFTW